jgi:hypothetical protein
LNPVDQIESNNKFIHILAEMKKSDKSLDIRILLPSPRFNKDLISRSISALILIKYFDRPLATNVITSILDS